MIDANFGVVLLPVGTVWDVVGGVSSASNPLCSTILEKSESDSEWEWVRISLFPLKYRGVIDF